jgi:hypothetical protein
MPEVTYKKFSFQTPDALVRKIWSALIEDTIYHLTDKDNLKYAVVELSLVSKTGLVNVASSILFITVNPHPWAQKIAEEIWQYAEDEKTIEMLKGFRNPFNVDCCKKGWKCEIPIEWEI